MLRYRLSYQTPEGGLIELRGLGEGAVSQIIAAQRALGSKDFEAEVNVFGRTAPVVVLPEKVEQAILSATGDAMARNEQGSVWRVVDGAWIEEN